MRADDNRNDRVNRVSRAVFGLSMLMGIVLTSGGCRLCCDLEDQAFPAYGGVWERTQRDSGRVGSLFDPGGARTSDLSPRDSAGDDDDERSSIAPYGGKKSEEDESGERVIPERKSDEETEQEFQDRLKEFEADKEKMLSAGLIPGEILPPDLR